MASNWVALIDFDPDRAMQICRDAGIPADVNNGYCLVRAVDLADFCAIAEVTQGETRNIGMPGIDGIQLVPLSLREKSGKRQTKKRVLSDDDKSTMEKFIDYCAKGYENDVNAIRRKKEEAETKVAKATEALIQACRDKEAVEQQIVDLEARGIKAIFEEDLEAQYWAIKNSPQVADVKFIEAAPNSKGKDIFAREGELVVTTNDIIHRNVGHTPPGNLGTFEIHIALGSSRIQADHYGVNKVKIVPLDMKARHFHYNPSYREMSRNCYGFCLGSYENLIIEPLKKFKLAQAVAVIITYLEEA